MRTHSYRVTRQHARLWPFVWGGFQQFVGHVTTPDGIVAVEVFRPLGAGGEPATYLHFVYEGRHYTRKLDRALITERSASIAAGKFARAVRRGEVAHG